MSRVAVNVCDLHALIPRGIGLNPVAVLMSAFADKYSPTVIIDRDRWDSAAVILDGPGAENEERAAALVKLLQTEIGPRELGRRVRCYKEGPKGGWSEIRPEK